MLRIGLKLNKVTEILKIKNPEIRKNPEESHPCRGFHGTLLGHQREYKYLNHISGNYLIMKYFC